MGDGVYTNRYFALPDIVALAVHKEDDPAISGQYGVFALAVRNDGAATVVTSNNGDYSQISVDDRGRVFVNTDPEAAGTWQTLRTFAGAVADVTSPSALQSIVGNVDMNAFVYPGALPTLTVVVNGVTCTFAALHPTNLADLLALLNAAQPDMTWTCVGPNWFLTGTKKTPGNIVLSGTALATLGLGGVPGTTGAWVALPVYAPMVEVGFIPGFSVANAPKAVILRLWRLTALTGGVADIAGVMYIDATDIDKQEARRFSFDGLYAYVTVEFVGGAAPTLTGTSDIRVVYDGDQPVESPTFHPVGPSVNAADTWDNAPTQAIYNYGTARGDATAVRASDNSITLTMTAGIPAPVSAQLCRVRVFIDATTAPLTWEQKRSAILSIAAGVVTVNALDGTVITVPAAATQIEVMWCGPDKDVAQEDSPHVSGEFISKGGRVRRDTAVNSAGSDGDWCVPGTDADGFDYVRDKAYDSASNANRVSEIAPLWSRNVQTPVPVAAALTVTGTGTTWQDIGTSVEVGTQGYKTIGLWLVITMGTTTNLRVRALYKHTAADTDEYNGIIAALDISGTPYNEKIEPSYQEFNVDADGKVVLPFAVENFIPYVQFQVLGEVLGATPAIIASAKVTYGY